MAKITKALYGLIGFPVKHSLSGAMHNAAFAACNIPAEYKLFEVSPESLESFLLNNQELSGFNITIPHKVRALEILEKKFPFGQNETEIESRYYVKLSGAINTVKRTGSELEYFNTDAAGFLMAAKEDLNFDFKGKTVMLFGCGGAGRAVVAALSWKNEKVKKIYLYDLRKEAILSLKEHLNKVPDDWRNIFQEKIEFIQEDQIAEKIKDCQLLVNASPLGMKAGDSSPIAKDLLHKGLSVYDLVYNRDTALVREARQKCQNAIGGLGMLLYQGVASWEIWTDRKASNEVIEVMKKALEKELNKKC
ncbi:MAG: shikimate dehydrogenase [Candidatus Omnitrophica bacterium]|nr:shikimate dehydrogenase [Candidatus Omnitrophota bacterium]MBU2043739.1 shikimate dehydrogenase [Candidatus Omnitrophota bacterium]MBU2251502.1 shikimate dehydrogenase [Candidatus Omnitrophota bacterium]MBU2473706.1 shikimate dehydrogenase [Candidatus Omnitrophota bacterium]